jgi:hypothetical protein
MSDDLVKRLRDWTECDEGKINDTREDAADRIDALEAFARHVFYYSNDAQFVERAEALLSDTRSKA